MELGVAQSKLSWDKVLALAFLAGSYMALGGCVSIMIGGGYTNASFPGLRNWLFGVGFPVGLILIVLAGGELFTVNLAIMFPAAVTHKITWHAWFKNLCLSYLGNFIGSIFVAYFLAYLSDLFVLSPWKEFTTSLAVHEIELGWGKHVLRGVACNWLLCLGVWMARSANEVAGKIMAIWFPVMAFATLGFGQSIGNMFFVPLGLMYGAEKTFWDFLGRDLVPLTFGNIIGGALLVGAIYFYTYLMDDFVAEEKKKEEVEPVPAPPAVTSELPK